MKKIKLTLGIILSIMLSSVAFADSPPSLNPQDTPPSLDGVQGGTTTDTSTPPSLDGVTQTDTPTNPTPDTPTNPTPTMPDNKGNTKPTDPVTPTTQTNKTTTKTTTTPTTPSKPGGLTETGPELLYLLIPSLVGGYAMRKRK